MKNFKTIISTLLLGIILSLGAVTLSSTTIHATDLGQVVDNIKSSNTQVLDGSTKDKVTGLSKQAMDIVGVIVMAVITISGLWCSLKFKGAGDNPQAKAVLKGVIIFHILALIFLASYFGFVKFAFKSFNLFK